MSKKGILTTRITQDVNLMNSPLPLNLDIYQFSFRHGRRHNKIVIRKGVMGMTLAHTQASLTPGLLSILLRLTTEIEWGKLPLTTIGTDGSIQHHPSHHGQTEHRTGKFFFISTCEPSHTTMFFCSHPRQGHGRPPMSHSHLHQHRPQMFQDRHAYSRDEPNQAASQGGRPPPSLSSQRPFDPSHRQPNQQPTPLHTQAHTHHTTPANQAGHPLPPLAYNGERLLSIFFE